MVPDLTVSFLGSDSIFILMARFRIKNLPAWWSYSPIYLFVKNRTVNAKNIKTKIVFFSSRQYPRTYNYNANCKQRFLTCVRLNDFNLRYLRQSPKRFRHNNLCTLSSSVGRSRISVQGWSVCLFRLPKRNFVPFRTGTYITTVPGGKTEFREHHVVILLRLSRKRFWR